MMKVLRADRERRYFNATASSGLPGAHCKCVWWRQMETEAEQAGLTLEQPKVAQFYNEGCVSIVQRNRCRQDDLALEHKYGTYDWSRRVNLSLFGICVVDGWMLYSGAHGAAAVLTPAQFIDN